MMIAEVETPPVTHDKHKFVSDVLRLVSGTFLAQVVSIISAPFLSRLFSPEAFGVCSLFVSITSVMGIVVCLRYDRSIIVPEQDEDGFSLVGVSMLFVLLVTALSGLFVWLGGPLLLRSLKAPSLGPYLWLVPINVFVLGVLAALNSWNTRKQHFTLITVAQVISTLGYVGLAITAGVLGHARGWSLIVATFLGLTASAIILLVKTWQECRSLLRRLNLRGMFEVLHRYRRFPKYSTGAAVLNSISWELPTFFLSTFFSSVAVGQYALGNRLIRIPMSLVGTNISRVFSQSAAQARYEGTLAPLVEKTFQSLVALGLFPFLLLALTGRPLFSLVFGARWADAGTYTEILSLWAFFWFISAPLGCALDILEEQAFDLRMNGVILVTRIASLLVGGYLGDARIALGIFSATGVLVYGYYDLAILAKCGLPASTPIRILGVHLVKFLPYGVLVQLCRLLGAGPVFLLVLSVILLLVYYLNILRTDLEAREIMFGLLRKGPLRRLVPEAAN